MSGYLISIIGTVLVCAVLTALLPNGKTAGVIKGIAKLACVISIIAPIPQFISDFGDDEKNNEKITQTVIQTDKSFIQYYCEMRIDNAKQSLENEIYDKFSIVVSCDIFWQFENADNSDVDEVKITKIAVKTLENTSISSKNEIKEYVMQNYCSEVQIE